MYGASAATMNPNDHSEFNISFLLVRVQTETLMGAQRIVLELDEEESRPASQKKSAWTAPLEGLQRCFPGLDLSLVGVVECAWEGAVWELI